MHVMLQILTNVSLSGEIKYLFKIKYGINYSVISSVAHDFEKRFLSSERPQIRLLSIFKDTLIEIFFKTFK